MAPSVEGLRPGRSSNIHLWRYRDRRETRHTKRAHIAAVEGDCEDLLVERACSIEIESRNFEPVKGLFMVQGWQGAADSVLSGVFGLIFSRLCLSSDLFDNLPARSGTRLWLPFWAGRSTRLISFC